MVREDLRQEAAPSEKPRRPERGMEGSTGRECLGIWGRHALISKGLLTVLETMDNLNTMKTKNIVLCTCEDKKSPTQLNCKFPGSGDRHSQHHHLERPYQPPSVCLTFFTLTVAETPAVQLFHLTSEGTDVFTSICFIVARWLCWHWNMWSKPTAALGSLLVSVHGYCFAPQLKDIGK